MVRRSRPDILPLLLIFGAAALIWGFCSFYYTTAAPVPAAASYDVVDVPVFPVWDGKREPVGLLKRGKKWNAIKSWFGYSETGGGGDEGEFEVREVGDIL